MMEVLMYVAGWFALGIVSFALTIYWWRSHFDVTVGLLVVFATLCLLLGPCGGASALMMLGIDAIERMKSRDRVIWRRRQ